ncbi:MAG: hypothetical protein ABWY06_06565 [Pseudomonas sp.]|uniref:hypothetical protein n=1 Tax=Pseudomonas sp. TaxID=306 RepID=UPI003398F97E
MAIARCALHQLTTGGFQVLPPQFQLASRAIDSRWSPTAKVVLDPHFDQAPAAFAGQLTDGLSAFGLRIPGLSVLVFVMRMAAVQETFGVALDQGWQVIHQAPFERLQAAGGHRQFGTGQGDRQGRNGRRSREAGPQGR